MVHIRASCTVNSVTLWFTVMYDITETEAAQVYADAITLCFELTGIQNPVGPYYQAIDTFLCLYDHLMPSGLEHCLFNCHFSLCSSTQICLAFLVHVKGV